MNLRSNTFLPLNRTPIVSPDNIFGKYIVKSVLSPPSVCSHERINSVLTDMDHFPYTRFFRGCYLDDNPRVFDREAGITIDDNERYYPIPKKSITSKPNWCFETACSTRTPCRPEYLLKDSDKQEMEPMLNRYVTNISP